MKLAIDLPDVETFIEEAGEAGARLVYVTCVADYRAGSGLCSARARVVVSAAGRLELCEGGASDVVLRHERDFGDVRLDPATKALPEGYRARVDAYMAEAQKKLAAAGLKVRAGEITAL